MKCRKNENADVPVGVPGGRRNAPVGVRVGVDEEAEDVAPFPPGVGDLGCEAGNSCKSGAGLSGELWLALG